MTSETYMPITPATRIPFPCWMFGKNTQQWHYFIRNDSGIIPQSWTHYCTSATEPTGRPGEKKAVGEWATCPFCGAPVKNASTEEQFEHAGNKYFCTTVFTACECFNERWSFGKYGTKKEVEFVAKTKWNARHASQPAVPTASGETNLGGDETLSMPKQHPALTPPSIPSDPASGATGEAKATAREILDILHSRGHLLRHHSYGTAPIMTEEEMSQIIARHFPASRPAVAQEGVRDTERLTWILEYISFHGLKGLEKITWSLYGENGQSMNHNKTVCEDDVDEIKFDRAAIDRAMPSQPEDKR